MIAHHGITESRSKLLHEKVTEEVIGAAIDVHRALGPGLLESAYEECFCHELHLGGLTFERQVALLIEYKGVKLDCRHRIDIVVENAIVLELKYIEHVLPVRDAQLLTYLRLSGRRRVGLILNHQVSALVREEL